MDAKAFPIPTGSFNAVLNAYAEAKEYADTETFFKFGLERVVVLNKFTYNIMIKASGTYLLGNYAKRTCGGLGNAESSRNFSLLKVYTRIRP